MSFAELNDMEVRGHTLVFNKQNPTWLEQGDFSRDEMIAILSEHIRTVVGRYRGRIKQWDVVNEAVEDDGTALRDSVWLRRIGPEYIDLAFRFAHEADPAARLFYNDYGAEGLSSKSDRVYALVQDLQQRGVPIHGVGFQMHTNLQPPPTSEISSNMGRLNALGSEIAITEMDVALPLPANQARLLAQAFVYHPIVSACVAAANCKTITTWGFTDKFSWIPSFFPGLGAALPFDEHYRPKGAYYAIRDGLGERTAEFFEFEAEDAAVRTNGDAEGQPITTGWRLRSNGHVAQPVDLIGKWRQSISVVAKGDFGNGWPQMEVRLGDSLAGSTEVATSAWRRYTFESPSASTGSREVRVSFTNDYFDGISDRNLVIDRVGVGSLIEAEEMQRCRGSATGASSVTMSSGGDCSNPIDLRRLARIQLRLIGRLADSAAGTATVAMEVDGNAVGQASIDSPEWKTYTIEAVVPQGRHQLTLQNVDLVGGRRVEIDRLSTDSVPSIG